MALIRIPDEQVKARAISLGENRLKQITPTGGKKEKALTEKEIRTLIKKADMEVRKELMGTVTEDQAKKNVDEFLECASPAQPEPESEDEPLTDEEPGWQPYLDRQIERCRKSKCPHLIDEEGDVSGVCLEMEAREKDRHPWRRYDCPLRPTIPESVPGSSGLGMTVREGPKRPETRISLFEREKPVPDKAAGPFKVAVTRGQEPIIRQMVKYQIADDETEAAQMAFDRGLSIILDEIEEKFQAEGEKS